MVRISCKQVLTYVSISVERPETDCFYIFIIYSRTALPSVLFTFTRAGGEAAPRPGAFPGGGRGQEAEPRARPLPCRRPARRGRAPQRPATAPGAGRGLTAQCGATAPSPRRRGAPNGGGPALPTPGPGRAGGRCLRRPSPAEPSPVPRRRRVPGERHRAGRGKLGDGGDRD